MRRADLLIGVGAALAALTPLAAAVAEEEARGLLTPSYTEFYGKAEVELTAFAEEGVFADQKRAYASFAVEPTLFLEWADGTVSFKARPFARLDPIAQDRTHVDFRDLKFEVRASDQMTLTFGADVRFWGKSEAVHLVDVINQTDFVEGSDGEDKLGQPLVGVSYLTETAGEFSAFYLPYFRERNFHGAESRLRLPFEVDGARYADGNEWSPGFAARWSHFIGEFDVGVSAFYGHDRAPRFEFTAPGQARAVYEQVAQIGFDGQYTTGPTLFKLEAIHRWDETNTAGQVENYAAATGGVEYTLYGIADTNMDLGLIGEYAWDQRGANARTPFENDLFAGVRLALNDSQDTSLLALGSMDLDGDGASFRLEAERRVFDGVTAALEAGAFVGDDATDDFFAFRNDHYIRLKLSYNW